MAKPNTQLAPGLYVRVQCQVNNLSFKRPDLRGPITVAETMTAEDLFAFYDPKNLDSRTAGQQNSPAQDAGKAPNRGGGSRNQTTTSSSWIPVRDYSNFIAKSNDLMLVAERNGWSHNAADRVAEFKKNADAVWKQYLGKEVTPEILDEIEGRINSKRLVAFIIRVQLLNVTTRPQFDNHKPDANGYYWQTRTTRKLYGTNQWLETLLESTANMLADANVVSDRRYTERIIQRKDGRGYGISTGEVKTDREKRLNETAALFNADHQYVRPPT